MSHFAAARLSTILPYLIAAYLLVVMLRQNSILTFLSYKLLFIIYVGWCLVAHHLDILALVLWIVYGSFIVVMFIFSFLWLDTKQPLRLHHFHPRQQSLLTGLCVSTGLILGLNQTPYINNLVFMAQWINHYELLGLHNSEEIESLGWALSTDNMLATIFTSVLLTLACVTALVIIINAKKQKWLNLKKTLHLFAGRVRLVTAAIRQQLIYQQEARELTRLNRVHIHGHGRRA